MLRSCVYNAIVTHRNDENMRFFSCFVSKLSFEYEISKILLSTVLGYTTSRIL